MPVGRVCFIHIQLLWLDRLKNVTRRTCVPLKILLVKTKKATATIKVMKVRGFDSRAVTYVILAGMFGTR